MAIVKPYTFSDIPANTNIIDADEVNANFDALYDAINAGLAADYIADKAVTSRKFFPTAGQASISGSVAVGTSATALTGASVTFTPATNSYALVVAAYDFSAVDASGALYQVAGALQLNGVSTGRSAYLQVTSMPSGVVLRQTIHQNYLVSLTGGVASTLRLVANRNAATDSANALEETGFTYMVIAR